MKVRVSAYQSISAAEIEATGFTAVTGSSNIGKSALLRAVAAALFGQEGDHFVRKGEAACAVTVEHAGHTIEWQKVRKKRAGLENCVVVDGEKFTRLGKGHGDLIGPLGYRAIRAGDDLVRPQYATQYDDIFLLTSTPNAAAEVFKQLGRVDVVSRAQGAAKGDLRSTVSKRGVREQDAETAWEALCVLGWVDAFEEFHRQLVDKVEAKQAQAKYRADLGAEVGRLAELGEPRILPAAPEIADTAPLVRLLEQVEAIAAVAPRGELPVAPDLMASAARTAELRWILDGVASYAALDDEGQQAANDRAKAEQDVLSAEVRKLELEEELGACPLCQREFEAGALELGAAARDCERCKPRTQP